MFDINHTLQTSNHIVSLLLVGLIIFIEFGIPIGFFLPGDTMLFSAGYFAYEHFLPLGWLIVIVVAANILGSNCSYVIGSRLGRKLFSKPGSIFFRQDYLDSAEDFYDKHGGKTIAISQFIPVIRTFAPLVAGMSKMKRDRFIYFNTAGAIVWATLIILLGYWLGKKIPNIDKYILPVALLAIIFSFAPAGWHLFGSHENRKKIVGKFRRKDSN